MEDSSHSHKKLKGAKLIYSILLNVIISLAQAAGGLLTGSLSLLADALHNFSDVVALIISHIASRLIHRQSTTVQTFGYKRAGIIAALINAVTLLAIAFNLTAEAVRRIKNPVAIDSAWIIILAFSSILINLFCVLLLRKDSRKNLNMKSAYLHLFSDMITSVAVLLGGLAMSIWSIYWLDSLLSVLISLYLGILSWKLLMTALRVLMQFTPADINLRDIEREVLKIAGVKNIHHIHLWQFNEKEFQFEAHIDFIDDVKLSESREIIRGIAGMLENRFSIHHSVLQPEYGVTDSKDLIVSE